MQMRFLEQVAANLSILVPWLVLILAIELINSIPCFYGCCRFDLQAFGRFQVLTTMPMWMICGNEALLVLSTILLAAILLFTVPFDHLWQSSWLFPQAGQLETDWLFMEKLQSPLGWKGNGPLSWWIGDCLTSIWSCFGKHKWQGIACVMEIATVTIRVLEHWFFCAPCSHQQSWRSSHMGF